jgi:YtkA-like protein
MRYLVRAAGILGMLGALFTVMAGAALAGNFAQVSYVDGTEEPPTAGEERDITFVLLQHGVTPIDEGNVQLTLTNAGSGEELTVTAVSLGEGTWRARVTFPSAGEWQLGVRHEWFETSTPVTIAVADAPTLGWLQPTLAIGAFGAAVALLAGMVFVRQPSVTGATPVEGPARAHG